ncbi:MAG: discoidin domain-containing protein [Bryobacterales bacterium]|nr:discoidin domain-containing protein [Bryobacteraceae bacterium]MDW8354275.1 discoidin domain-containing protein [Bryobacterales bacterium]
MIPQPVYILFGAAFTVAVSLALGRMLLRALGLRLHRTEEGFLAFVTGGACLSALIFWLAVAHWLYKGVLLALGAAVLVAAWRQGAHRRSPSPLPPLEPFWKRLFAVVIAAYTVLYFANAMAPEISADGTEYHLGLVARYLRERGFPRITTNMYASLSQGVELLFLYAYAFGRHSAAALVHFAFLAALPFGMIAWARRFGVPAAGVAGALLFYLSPVVGIDGTSAYVDVAVAAVAFAVFYLLQLWDRERAAGYLVPIGLLSGFAYAAKYTAFVAFPYAVVFVAWKLRQARQPLWRPLAVLSLCAALIAVPWAAKNWIVVDNPFSPFFNAWFRNPHVHVSFEEEYRWHMRHYPGLASYAEIPLEVTVRGHVLAGLLGPVFLLAPLALLALRWPQGRRLLAAAGVFGATYFANIGTRFLIPAAPFVALAMAMVLTRTPGIAPAVVVFHGLISWPSHIKMYADPYSWRLERVTWREALRLIPEEEWLRRRLPGYSIARMIEDSVPAGEKVFAWQRVAEAYTTREILVAYTAAFNHTLGDILWTPLIPAYHPVWRFTFQFEPQRLRKLRVVQYGRSKTELWAVNEFRIQGESDPLPRRPAWRLTAQPNPWEVDLAFDGNPATRWRSWEAMRPGMFVEVDLGEATMVSRVVLECSQDHGQTRLKLEAMDGAGRWKLLGEPQFSDASAPEDLRRRATQAVKAHGVRYLLIHDSDFRAEDFRMRAAEWGLRFLGERAGARLYRIE